MCEWTSLTMESSAENAGEVNRSNDSAKGMRRSDIVLGIFQKQNTKYYNTVIILFNLENDRQPDGIP